MAEHPPPPQPLLPQVLDMPQRLTAYGGLDTLTHALERCAAGWQGLVG